MRCSDVQLAQARPTMLPHLSSYWLMLNQYTQIEILQAVHYYKDQRVGDASEGVGDACGGGGGGWKCSRGGSVMLARGDLQCNSTYTNMVLTLTVHAP